MLLRAALRCYNWLFLTERKTVAQPETIEFNFTNVVQGIFADYIERTSDAVGNKPNIVRMEDNRILWQFGKTSMSITINDVSREYTS